MALADLMRLSLGKGAYTASSSAAWQEIRVGMTKGRTALPLELGCADPRSQTRDLGHPSICRMEEPPSPLSSRAKPRDLRFLLHHGVTSATYSRRRESKGMPSSRHRASTANWWSARSGRPETVMEPITPAPFTRRGKLPPWLAYSAIGRP